MILHCQDQQLHWRSSIKSVYSTKPLALTNASSSRAKTVLKAIGMTPKQLSKGMVKDSRATMIKVLEGLSKLPKDKQAKGLEWLFGRESIKAIAPLLTNLDLLKANFDKVADKQKYGGSMEVRRESRSVCCFTIALAMAEKPGVPSPVAY